MDCNLADANLVLQKNKGLLDQGGKINFFQGRCLFRPAERQQMMYNFTGSFGLVQDIIDHLEPLGTFDIG